jgi:multimeric flavodoxin WrbA
VYWGKCPHRDDFATVVGAMSVHDAIIFATPVYWYSMSGRLKVLFDRFTDLVTVRKDLGRGLRGRSVFVLSCGSEKEMPVGFEVPFRDTAQYLGMNYEGALYVRSDRNGLTAQGLEAAKQFGRRIVESQQER